MSLSRAQTMHSQHIGEHTKSCKTTHIFGEKRTQFKMVSVLYSIACKMPKPIKLKQKQKKKKKQRQIKKIYTQIKADTKEQKRKRSWFGMYRAAPRCEPTFIDGIIRYMCVLCLQRFRSLLAALSPSLALEWFGV